MHTNVYKGGGGGLNMTKNTHSVCSFIENAAQNLYENCVFSKYFLNKDNSLNIIFS